MTIVGIIGRRGKLGALRLCAAVLAVRQSIRVAGELLSDVANDRIAILIDEFEELRNLTGIVLGGAWSAGEFGVDTTRIGGRDAIV